MALYLQKRIYNKIVIFYLCFCNFNLNEESIIAKSIAKIAILNLFTQ